MQDILDKLMLTLWSVWRFRWTALVVAWLVAVVGWTGVAMLEYRYTASARIFVDTNRVLAPLLRDITVQPDVKGRVALISRALLTRPNLEELVRMTDLDHDIDTQRGLELLLIELKSRLSLKSGRRDDSIYTVRYEHSDPTTAKRVVQSLITIFIENNLGDEREDSQSAETFLDDQIVAYEGRLVEAESRLSDFRRNNVGATPNQAGDYYQRLDNASSRVRTAGLELKEATNRRDELVRQLEQERSAESNVATGSAQQSRILGLQDELDGLLTRYTERHPQVSQLREMISDLRNTDTSGAGQSGELSGQERLQNSVVYQNLRTLVSEASARVAELTARVEDYEQEVAELRLTVDSIPLVEAELLQLDRDYETLRTQHALLLERRESAQLSKRMGQDVDDVKFRIIDPPFVPSKPTSPNKLLLNAAVMAAGLGAGTGLALLLSLIRPVYYGQRSLALATGVPVYGSVSLYRGSVQRFKGLFANVTFLSFSGLLTGMFAVIMVFQLYGLTLEQLSAREELAPLISLRDADLVQRILSSELGVKIVNTIQGDSS